MKLYLVAASLAVLPSLASAQEAAAPQAESSAASSDYYAAGGEGRVLPENVMRVRLPLRIINGNKVYDKDGKKQDLPYDISVTAGAFVLEYGVTERLTAQVLMNYFYGQKVTARSEADVANNPQYLAAKAAYKAGPEAADLVTKNQTAAIKGLADKLGEAGNVCGTAATCLQALNGNMVKNSNADTPLSGALAGITIPAGVDFKTYVDAAVKVKVEQGIDAGFYEGFKAKAKREGNTGIGDTDVGLLYAILKKDESPIEISAGGGVRFPTGKIDVEEGKNGTGRGTTDLGLRLNIDYGIMNGLYLCFQHQVEMMISKGKQKNALGTKVDYERTGARQVGFLKAAWGLGNISQALAPIGIYSSFNYDHDAKLKIDGVEQGDPSQVKTTTVGVTADGLAYQVPVQLDVEYDMSMSGKNANVLNKTGVTLKAFYKF